VSHRDASDRNYFSNDEKGRMMQTNDVRPNAIADVINKLPPEAPRAVHSLLAPLAQEVALLHVMEDAQPTEAQAARIDAQRAHVRHLVAQSEPEIAREISAWRAADNVARMPGEKFAADVCTALRVALFVRQPHATRRG
jgi:hypothetical protein